MKKSVALLCILSLLLLSCALAEGSYTARVGGVPLLNVRYDDVGAADDLGKYLCAKWNGTLVETTGGSLPFVILSLNGPTGQSYCAAALIQGYVVHFEIFSYGGTEGLNTLKQLLAGVNP